MSDCDVKEFKLCELLKIYNGTKYDHLNKGDIPLYGSGGLMSHVDEALYSGEAILLPRKGTLSNIMYVNESFWTVDTMYYAVVNDKLADAFYLYSYLSQLDLSNLDSGSTLPSMTKSAYESIVVKLPDLRIQKAVATILFNIRKKLETNNQINQELEAMAKTLYDYWFVQFDYPDQNGKPYKSSGGKMVYNPELKREIPEGWGVSNLFDAAEVQYGYPFSTDYFNSTGEGVPVIRIRDILGNDITNYSTEEVEDKYRINVGDVLIGMDGNFHMNYWIKENCYLNQRVVKVNSDKLPNMVLKYQIEPFIKLREKSVSRTTVGHLSDKDLKAINVILPKDKCLSSIFEKFESILENIIINQQQNQELTQLRDWLLPMLMNGQVKVE
ncbi:restriction endonuclease subunit S [Streptococcus sanguinis]|uniref:restriction endonuclease subunit S n=1 Tax=Streptococcus sanguinis TaxID=1305 RepID=UPI001CBB38AD|nr:restriction endonuclease subunit S [Streptococcus sanguinis]MBZ2024353.1 restriction endonuclease subunit S [Streptococcus sanguinis]MBZ2049046.1 restriction endonuclease subunit S [Streptococcus sanguinis]MBZ2051772.1 restriction endonuclease subunit S [Streptococcus sanguinis]MBZ2060620.1 restriction endonuclease subunit S [Streptococcus sanguinis]MCC3176225.1 type I restriction modification DNA specificity domain protein [Streptococcus sanguinis]